MTPQADWSPPARGATSLMNPDGSADTDVLELPEPMLIAPARRPRQSPVADMDLKPIDYQVWSAELEDLLKRPLEPASATADRAVITAKAASHPRSITTSDRQGPGANPPVPRPRRKAGVWMPVIGLCLAGALVGGILGAATYGLAKPEAKSWLLKGVGHLIERLHIALPL